MTTATSLILIAGGAILAFAVSYTVAGISIQTVGIILIVVGGIGLAFSLLSLAGLGPRLRSPAANTAPATSVAPPTSSPTAAETAPAPPAV